MYLKLLLLNFYCEINKFGKWEILKKIINGI